MTTKATTIAKALAAAQAEARGVEKLAHNDFARYDYASAEQMIAYATSILGGHGLALLPTTSELIASDRMPSTPWVLRQSWSLMHESGETLALTRDWPATVGKGKPEDKAVAGAYTASLGYLVRDLLLVPRVEKGTDLNDPRAEDRAVPLSGPARHQQQENEDKAARRAKAPLKADAPRWTDAEQKAFCAAITDLGLTYDEVADWCEAQKQPRPSALPADRRRKLLDFLTNKGLPGPNDPE